MKKARIINRAANILFAVLFVIVLVVTIPNLMGYTFMSVISDSMEPTIPVGSLILIEPTTYEHLQSEDVITFYGKQGTIVTHRIVEKNDDRSITTKGDHNKEADLGVVYERNVIGKLVVSVPFIGYLFMEEYAHIGIVLLIAILAIIVGLWIYSYHIKKQKPEEPTANTEA